MPRSETRSVIATVARPQHRVWIEIAFCAMLAGLLVWKGILPGWRFLNTDFPNYYLVARLLREGYALDRIYDWVWLQRIKDHWGLDQPLVGFAGLTPFSALPIVPFSFFSALVAKRLWMIANLLLLALSIELLNRVTVLGRRRLWLLCLLAVFPLRTSFLLGQMHLLVLCLFAGAYLFHLRGKQVSCAFCLSIAGLLKVYPLLFGFYFLWKRQWRSAAAMLCAVLLLVGAGYLWIGRDAINIYWTQVVPRSLQGEVLDPYSVHAASASALFHRLFIFEPTLNPAPMVEAPALFAVLYPLWQLVVFLPLLALLPQRARPRGEQLEWAAYLFALLVLSPVPASYHFVVMIFSLILLIDHLLVTRKKTTAALAAGLYCAISTIDIFPSPGANVFAFGRLWLELGLLAVFFLCLWENRTNRTETPRLASLFAVAAVVWSAGVLGYLHHFAYLEKDLAGRLRAAPASYLSTGYLPTPAGYRVIVMAADGYHVVDQNGQAPGNNASDHPRSDQLSAATAQNAPGTLIEVADKSGSFLMAIPPTDRLHSGEAPRLLIQDAESPAISSDGTSVAFIREVKGHGTLWFGRLQQPFGHLRSAPIALTDQQYDVRDVSFVHSEWMLFTARVDGHSSIFSLLPGSRPRVFLSGSEDVDSPSVSADERFIAFRKLLHGRWQLGYMDVATGHQRMLTFGDCNAYSPAWVAPATIAYATDCGRGLGLGALTSIRLFQNP